LSENHLETIVYVDGFNLYYGALTRGSCKWLDLGKFFSLLRPHDSIRNIRYFTAIVGGHSRSNQEMYLRALQTIPNLTVVLGKFKTKRVICKHSGCNAPLPDRVFNVLEEKRTDVNIAVTMLDDAYQNKCEQMILVSGDSDLVPAVATVRMRFPKINVIVYVPANNPVRGQAFELRGAANRHRDLPLNLLGKALFPSTIIPSIGPAIVKPNDW
jgi:6-hydroxy-3-succinoylpyridine 3-monooxygenase